MSKIVKFKKEHVAGFSKGDVREVDETLAEKLIKDKFAEEGTEEDLANYRGKLSKIKAGNPQLEEAKELANSNNSDCEGCTGDEPCDDCGDTDAGPEKKYHVLTQEDIDANEEAAEGLEVGDEVEENEEGYLILEEGKLVKKPEEAPEGNA